MKTMKAYMNETISCNYRIGRETILSPSWYGKNIVIPDSKIYYILDGEIEIEFENERILAEKGDILLIPAKQKHSCYMTEKKYARKYWLHFELKSGNNDFFDNYILAPRIHIGVTPYVCSLFEELFQCNDLEQPYKQLISSAVICKLVSYYMEHCTVLERKQSEDDIDKAIDYIKNNYAEFISLKELAQNANFTPNYFIKKFQERTGYTPIKYVNMIRIEIAKSYLLHSEYSVNHVLEKVGFLDSAYFSKLFKKTTGYSPKAFREMYLNKPAQE